MLDSCTNRKFEILSKVNTEQPLPRIPIHFWSTSTKSSTQNTLDDSKIFNQNLYTHYTYCKFVQGVSSVIFFCLHFNFPCKKYTFYTSGKYYHFLCSMWFGCRYLLSTIKTYLDDFKGSSTDFCPQLYFVDSRIPARSKLRN